MLISHPKEKNLAAKPLVEHLFNVGECCRDSIARMRLDLTLLTPGELKRLSFLIGLFHDFGKATPFFQNYIKNPGTSGDRFTRHSFLSALVGCFFIKQELPQAPWGYTALQVIKRHHGNLEAFDTTWDNQVRAHLKTAQLQLEKSLDNYYEEMRDFYQQHLPDFSTIRHIDFAELLDMIENSDEMIEDSLDDNQEKRIELFFITNLIFSLLIDSDKKDAARLDTDYFKGNLDEPVSDVRPFILHEIEQDPKKFGSQVPINEIRNQFLAEINESQHISADHHFYTLTAPTGIGKTFGCLAFANKLIERLPGKRARIIYCLPYTSIIDQNFLEFEKVIKFDKGSDYVRQPTRYLLKHHHLAAKHIENRVSREEYNYKDYLDDQLLVESWESAMIVTTFVQFFHSVIGFKNRLLKKFHHIVNSIVILDEVQNIDPDYYQLLKHVLHVLGKCFNTYFLLTTATQPEILDLNKSRPISLVESTRYMQHALFNRVLLQVTKEPQTLEDFKQRFCREFVGENCLIVLNTKGAAVELYRCIKGHKPEFQVFCLTTNLVPKHRENKIALIKEALKNKKKIILVSTQLIEAGVDISFKYVYRDFGPLDSIIQVAGRCNRSGEYGELGGHMTLVRLIDENHHDREYHSYIYKSIIAQLVEQTMAQSTYESKDFSQLSADYFRRFDFAMESQRLLKAICDLNYDREIEGHTPVKDFKLIKEYDSESLYILTSHEAQEDMDRLNQCIAQLYQAEISEAEKSALLLEIETLKANLREFQISLRKDELKNYQDTDILKGNDPYQYISYEDQKRYAYDEDIGFLKEPREQIPGTIHF